MTQKKIRIVFLLITISAMQIASGQQKNHPPIDKLKDLKKMEIFARGTIYHSGDPDSKAGRTASLIPIKTVKSLGLQCIAVDPKVIPYGSFIIGKDKNNNDLFGVAVDTGGAVKSRKAAKNFAIAKGFDRESPEYNALVLDIHSKEKITHEWDTFIVVVYNGPCFKFELNHKEKVEHILSMKKLYANT